MGEAGSGAPDLAAALEAARGGRRGALARLLSVVERGGDAAAELAAAAFPRSGVAATVGMTGAPGAGKSSLVSSLLHTLRARGSEVAVLAVDPSSPFSGGAILGDRVRMQEHALDAGVYIRSMASRGHLGGLALAVPEAVRVLEAVGFPIVVVETVGVGQVEVEVAGATDTTVVVVNPAWGDSVQASKAGLLEVADVLVINKADRPGARETRRDLQAMLDLSAPGGWRPPVVDTVATSGDGVAEMWEAVEAHRSYLASSGAGERRRSERLDAEVRRLLAAQVRREVDRATTGEAWELLRERLRSRQTDTYAASSELLAGLLGAV
ncbi:MAG: methylmalonyl Co-A mutase-associated GTPase MeaB [Acidimicrobiales bacterium]